MKYSKELSPLICMQTNSVCYKGTGKMPIRGVLWHSTGANNPNLKRYVQPFESDPDYDEMIALLGKNPNGNDWNHIYRKAGLNAWIGKLADGSVASIQTMPWDYMPWGCGQGKSGSCNNGWIQFEICEDSLKDRDYFEKVYREACELTAYLCTLYGLDPTGTVTYCGQTIPVILCHADSYKLGMGSNHGDVLHWFSRYGKSMDDVRRDVAELMEEDMTQEKFNELMNGYLKTLQDNDCAAWSEDGRKYVIENGLFVGSGTLPTGEPNYMWHSFLNREQISLVLKRFADLYGLEKK